VKKYDRLSKLYFALCNKEGKVSDLAKRYGVSERTIQNDIKELSKSVKIISPSRGVYKIIPEKIIEKKFKEVFSKLIIKANYDIFYQFEDLIKEIQFYTSYMPTESFEINFKIEHLKDKALLINLMNAIEEDFSLKFDYKGKERIIQPLKILNYNSFWYLIGFDLTNNKIKSFKINKIENFATDFNLLSQNELKILKRQVKFINTPWINENKNEAVCRIYYPLNESIIGEVINEGRDFTDIRIEYYDEREAFDLIKRYLPYVKIIDEELREKVKRLLKESIIFL